MYSIICCNASQSGLRSFPQSPTRRRRFAGLEFHHERDSMVRQTRFSFDEGMKVDYPEPEDEFDDDELDGFVAEAPSPLKKPHAPKRERKRNQPGDRRPDRRHLADGDWL